MGCCKSNEEEKNEIEIPKINQTNKKTNYDGGNINFEDKKQENSKKISEFVKINNYDIFNDQKSSSSKKESISESNNFNDIQSSDNDEVNEEMEYIIKKNWMCFVFVFGTNFQNRYIKFLKNFGNIFELSCELKTSLYNLSYKRVQEIIDGVNDPKISENGFISEKFYNLVLNFGHKLKKINHVNIYELLSGIKDIQVEIIAAYITNLMLTKKLNKNNLTFYFIRYFQDIGFCIRLFYYSLFEILYQDEFLGYEYHFDIRILYFLNISASICLKVDFPQDLLKYATEPARVKDTIIIGNKDFKNHIRGHNLSCERINELDDNKFDSFFKNPYKVDNKYKITKYFVICEKEVESKY